MTLTIGTLTFDPNSALTGTDSFVANGLLTLGPNSQLSVAGSVDANGGLALSDGPVTIQGTALNNYSAATWDLGPLADVFLDAGAIINNMGGATFATVGANNGVNNIQGGDSSAVAFDNAGTFTSSAPTGVNIKVPFVNTGSTVVQQGDLNVPNFTNSGTLSVDAGASFNGSGSLQSPIVVSTGNTLTTTPGETLTTSVILAGGTLDVTGQLTLDGTLALANGSMLEGAGPVDAFGGVSIEGNVAISATTLNNYGAATWDQSAIFGPESIVTLSSGAAINNLAGATLTTVGDLGNPNGGPGGEIIAGDSSAVAFSNAGTFLCQQGSEGGATSIAVPFTQTSTGATVVQGQLAALSLDGESTIAGSMTAAFGAQLIFQGGGTVGGSLSGATGSLIDFYGSSYALDATSSVTSTGTVYFQQIAAVTVSGTYDVSGSTLVSGGTLIVTAPIADMGADLNINRGTVDITTAQSFSFASVEILNGTLSGAGSVNVTITASMSWDQGTISGLGTLTIASGATLSLGGPQRSIERLDGTTLDNAGTANLTSVFYTDGMMLEDGAGIDNEPGGSFTFLGNSHPSGGAYIYSDSSPTFFTNEGSLIRAGTGSGQTFIQTASFTETSTGSTVLSGGSLEFDGNAMFSGSITAATGTTLTFAGPSTRFDSSSSLTSTGFVVLENTTTVAGAYDVAGTTLANSSSGITFTAPITDLGAYLEVADATLNITTNQSFSFTYLDVGEGRLSGGGGNLTVTGSMVWNGAAAISGFGTLTIASGAVLHLSTGFFLGTETLNGVKLDNAGVATLVGAVGSNNGLALENEAEFVNEPGGSFTILTSGPITSDGTATAFINQGNLIVPATAIGQTVVQPAFTQTTTGTTVVNVSGLTLEGGGSPVTNAGNVTVESGGTLSVSTDYDQSAGSTTLFYGTFSGVNLNIAGGDLAGTGVVNANVSNAGLILPGGQGAAGLLTIIGNYTQTAFGSLNVDLGGTTAGSRYDQLAVSGTASLGGILNVTTIDSFQPVSGNAFEVLTFNASSGNFGFYNGIVLGNHLILNPALNPTNLTLTVQPAVTTTTLSTPASPSVSGQSVTFTATVTVALPPTTIDPTPTGTVTIYNNGQSIGTGPLSVANGQEQTTFTTNTLSTASHSITAVYTSGDANFLPSPDSSAVTQVVNKASTSATVVTSASPTVYGQAVTLTATVSIVSPGSTAVASPTGTVTFYDNGTAIGTGTLSVVSGQDEATLTTSALSTSSHPITAAYTSGDGNFNASPVSSSVSQQVNKDSTTTVASASPALANVGQAVTFTATVTANAPGSGTPTGTVDFYDTSTSTDLTPGGIALSSGTATFSTTSLAVGSHTIKASYSGDGNFLTSSASTSSITIGQSIIVLDPSAGGALSLSGNASVKLTGGVYVDSSSSTALSASGNAAIKASVIDVHGGVQKSGNANFSPTPTTGAAAVSDPLASLAEPSASGLTNYGSESLSGNSSATIKPGIYSQITVSGNGTLTMNSGIYIIEGGGFTVSGNASVTGSGVMILNADSTYPTTGGTYGSITLSGSGSYNLSPATSGTYAGIVIFQTRDNSKAVTLSGNAAGMTGTIYAPAAQLAESGNASLNAAVIVDTLTISGNGINNTVTLSSPNGTVAYTPAQIRSAYGISALSEDGTGQTIAIVDAYDDPMIYQALDAFDSQFGLTSSVPTLYNQYGPASSFLTVLNQSGQATSLPSTDPNGPGTDNWELEEELDVEWTHAIAPAPRSSWSRPTANRFRT